MKKLNLKNHAQFVEHVEVGDLIYYRIPNMEEIWVIVSIKRDDFLFPTFNFHVLYSAREGGRISSDRKGKTLNTKMERRIYFEDSLVQKWQTK